MVILQIGDPVVCHFHLLFQYKHSLNHLIVFINFLFQLFQSVLRQRPGRNRTQTAPAQRTHKR